MDDQNNQGQVPGQGSNQPGTPSPTWPNQGGQVPVETPAVPTPGVPSEPSMPSPTPGVPQEPSVPTPGTPTEPSVPGGSMPGGDQGTGNNQGNTGAAVG